VLRHGATDEGVVGSAEALRRVMADFASGVTVVSAVWRGSAHAMTATAFCSVSLEPPLVLVCVSRTSRFHEAISGSGRWAASLLAGDQVALARHFSNRGRDLLTQFDDVPHTLGPETGAPVLTGALAWLECTTYSAHEAGDHTVIIGEIKRTSAMALDRQPLTYFRGTYHPLQAPSAEQTVDDWPGVTGN
jgi:flavin reductase (DIM6/NTAB) family NADH-FMN oxidoreductase RutF